MKEAISVACSREFFISEITFFSLLVPSIIWCSCGLHHLQLHGAGLGAVQADHGRGGTAHHHSGRLRLLRHHHVL